MPLGEIYIKLAVTFADDPKVRALARYGTDAGLARDLYVQMILHCKRLLTDGFVPAEQIGLLVYPLDPEHGNQLAKQLASVGLIKEVSNAEASDKQGWEICAYVKRNGTKEDVERLSQVRAEAGRTGGIKSRKRPAQRTYKASGKQVANQDAEQNGSNPVSVSVRPNGLTEARDIQMPTASDAEITGELVLGQPTRNVGDVVAAYVDGATAAGLQPPPTNLRARVGKQARQLIGEGWDADFLVGSARRMGAGEFNDLGVQARRDDAAAKGVTATTPDRRQQATNDKFARAMERAKAREGPA